MRREDLARVLAAALTRVDAEIRVQHPPGDTKEAVVDRMFASLRVHDRLTEADVERLRTRLVDRLHETDLLLLSRAVAPAVLVVLNGADPHPKPRQ